MSESAPGPETTPVQDLTLQVHVPEQIQGGGLKALRQELAAIDTYLGNIQGRFQDVTRRSFTGTGVDGFKAKLEAAFNAAGNTVNLNVREMAKQLDLLHPKFEQIFGRYRQRNPDSFRTKDTAASPQKLAEFFNHLEQRYQRREFATGQVVNRAFRNALYGGASGPAVNPRVGEVQQVAANHDRLIAALDRLTLAVETKGVGSAGQGAGSGAAATTTATEPKEPKWKEPATVVDSPNQLSKKIRAGKSGASTTTVDDLGDGKTLETVFDKKGNKKVEITRLNRALEKRQDFLDLLEEERKLLLPFQRSTKADSSARLTESAQAYAKAAAQIKATTESLNEDQRKVAGRPTLRRLNTTARRYEFRAEQLRAMAEARQKVEAQAQAQGGQSLADAMADGREARRRERYAGQLAAARPGLQAATASQRAQREQEKQQALASRQAEEAAREAARQKARELRDQRHSTRELLSAIGAANRDDRSRLRTDDRNQAAKNRARAKVQDAVAAASEARAEVAAGEARSAQLQFTRKQADALMADLKSAGYRRGAENSNRSFSEGGSGERKSFDFTKDEGGRRITQRFTEIYKNGRLATVEVQTLGKEIKSLNRGVDSGKGFLENTEHVSRWALSVGALYGSLALARSGLQAFLNLSYEVARLDQVYQKQGGTTRALADDVLHLAAANGRSSQEALQAATAWARLGLTRQEINEAVRVSLLAANVAELDTLEATKFLQSTMAAYGLKVREVSGFLAGLNDISNKFNVTNADLLEGISKVANVAKQAGIPLAELRGLIGAAVGTTGQSGANIGNALKSVIVALSNPVLQKTLKSEFGLDMVDPRTGDLQDFSKVLAELYLRYQDLNDAERQSLLFQTAGKTQASKLAGMLDSYIRGQVLAVNALLNLNSAEAENAKIKETLRAELAGLVTEFDRFALKMGGSGPAQGIGLAANALKNLLTVLQLPGVSTALMGVITLLGALTVRLTLTKTAMDDAGRKVGWFDKSLRNVGDRARHTWLGVGQVIRGVATDLESAGGKAASLGRGLRVTDYYLRLMKREGFSGMSRGMENLSEAFAIRNRRGLGGRAAQAGLGLAQVGVSSAVAAGGVGGRLLLGGALSVGMAIPQILAGMLALGAATWGVNKAMSAMGLNTDRVDKLFGGFTAELNKAEAAAQAAAMQVKFLDTAIRALGSGRLRDGERKSILESLGDLEKIGGEPGERQIAPADLAKLAGLGDATMQTTAQEILGKYQDEAINRRVQALQDAYTAAKQRVEEMEREVPRIRDPKARAEARAQLDQMKADKGRLITAIADGDAADVGVADEMKKTAQLERQKLVLEAIRDLYSQMGSVDPLTRYQAGADAAEAALRFAEADVAAGRDRLKGFEPLFGEARQQADALRAKARAIRDAEDRAVAFSKTDRTYDLGRLREAADLDAKADTLSKTGMPTADQTAAFQKERNAQDARIKAADDARMKAAEATDPRKRLLAEQLTAYEDAKRAQRDANLAFGVGDSEGERLADRRLKLEQERVRLQQQADQGLASLARQEQTIVDLLEVENQLRERSATIERDIAQAKRDSDREFNRNFLEGDATSRLKRLAALKAQQMGLTRTAGGYMALGDLQRYLPDADKPFGRTADLRRERDGLDGGVYGPQPGPTQRRGQLDDVRNRFLNGPGAELAAEMTKLSGAAAVSFKALEKSASGLTVQLNAAAEAAKKFAATQGVTVPSGEASNPQSGGK